MGGLLLLEVSNKIRVSTVSDKRSLVIIASHFHGEGMFVDFQQHVHLFYV